MSHDNDASVTPERLRFVWWNVESLIKPDDATTKKRKPDDATTKRKRGPRDDDAYQRKLARVTEVLSALMAEGQEDPAIVGLCELTKPAAEDVKAAVFPGHRLLFSGSSGTGIALFIPDGIGLREEPELAVPNMPRTYRRMPMVDLRYGEQQIRFVFAHWPGMDDAEPNRSGIARYLGVYFYDYLYPEKRELGATKRHVLLIGDLQEEPDWFGQNGRHGMHASRSRVWAREQWVNNPVWQDQDGKRVHLYNCAWRFLGERFPHGQALPATMAHAAGTYYWRAKKTWHTLDHVIVSGGLLSENRPLLDEESLRVVPLAAMMDLNDRMPAKFGEQDASGASDHLPLMGRLLLR